MGTTRLAGSENEPHIIVNSDRTIFVPDELKCVAVQFDHNIETVTFDCPRYWDGHDFSTMRVYINYRRADGKMEPYPCEPPTIDELDESIIHFNWTVSQNVTLVKGKISFLVCVKNPDESGNLQNRWSSRLNQDLEVLEGLECSSDAIVSENPDIIEYILSRLDGAPIVGDGNSSSVDEIFVAVPYETLLVDIQNAVMSGKIVFANDRSANTLYTLSKCVGSAAIFTNISGNVITFFNVGTDNEWTLTKTAVALKSDLTSTIDENSTDRQYPSAKAVYTAINDMVSSIDTELLKAIGSGEVTV